MWDKKLLSIIDTVIAQISDGFTSKIFFDDLSLLVEDYIYEATYRFLFIASDDEEMKNKQVIEKVSILQHHIKPEMLAISTTNSSMKIISTAINGNLRRTQKN